MMVFQPRNYGMSPLRIESLCHNLHTWNSGSNGNPNKCTTTTTTKTGQGGGQGTIKDFTC